MQPQRLPSPEARGAQCILYHPTSRQCGRRTERVGLCAAGLVASTTGLPRAVLLVGSLTWTTNRGRFMSAACTFAELAIGGSKE